MVTRDTIAFWLSSDGNDNSMGVLTPQSLLQACFAKGCHQRKAPQTHHSRMLQLLACLPLMPPVVVNLR